MITLSGGPYDGQQIAWSGSDFVEMAPIPPKPPILDFSVETVDPFRVEKYLYRRSVRNPDIFVFQP